MFTVQRVTKMIALKCGLAVGMLAAFSDVLASTLQDVKFSELPGDQFEVRMKFDEQPQEPAGYTIEQPARIVLDFPDVQNALKQRKFPLSFDGASSAVVLSSGDRTRLILNLSELSTYTTRIDNNDLVVEVGRQTPAEFVKPAASMAQKVQTQSKAKPGSKFNSSISAIDFRRGENGEGKVIVDLTDPNVNIDVTQKTDNIEVSFVGASLPQELRRSLDVVDFATPVTQVDADYDGAKTTLTVKATGDYDYLAYQADNTYVVSIKPLTKAELEEKQSRFSFVGDKLSLNFQNIEVRSVLQLIADFTDLNLVASDTVNGSITLRLDNVPWDQALDLVLKTKGLDKRVIGNVMMVAPAAEIAERERQELETKKQLEELAPLYTEYVRVRFASAVDIFKLFGGDDISEDGGFSQGSDGTDEGSDGNKKNKGGILSPRGSAIVDERTNSIILTDTAEKIDAFKKLIAQIDIPIRQVMIEARVVIANSDFEEQLGIRWGGIGIDTPKNSTVFFAGSQEGLDSDPGTPIDFFTSGGTTDIGQDLAVDLGVTNPAGSLALGFLNDNILLTMELSALASSGYAEIVSQPKVITGDKQSATIQSGQEIPFLTTTVSATGTTTIVQYKEALLSLEVTPQITPDDQVIMDLEVKRDTVTDLLQTDVSVVPILERNNVETQVLVANGQTVVLGGVYQTQQVKSESKVPFFGDLPYIGRAFRNNVSSEDKRELLIFITPKILSDSLVE